MKRALQLAAAALGVGLALATGASVAVAAGVTSRAPNASAYQAIARAFQRDHRSGHRHAHDKIVQIRQTRHGRAVARVFFFRPRAHKSTSRGNGDIGQCGDCSDYYDRPTGEWKPDRKVTAALRDQLREVPSLWEVRFRGSGTDDLHASAPGQVAANPSCHQPPVVENDGTSFEFHVQFAHVWVGSTTGNGQITGKGTYNEQEQPGCQNDADPVTPQTYSCSADYFTPVFKAGGSPHAQLSGAVDRKGNHELRVHAPVPDKRPEDCASPDIWWIQSDGPVVFLRSVAIPDADLARGSEFSVKVGAKTPWPCTAPAGYSNRKCSEAIKWTGTILLSPVPDWRKFDFSGL